MGSTDNMGVVETFKRHNEEIIQVTFILRKKINNVFQFLGKVMPGVSVALTYCKKISKDITNGPRLVSGNEKQKHLYFYMV